MAQYKFDGKYLKRGGSTIANVSGKYIRKGSGGSTVANISGNNVRQGSGGSTLINVSGDNIRQGSGGSTIAKMRDVRKEIDGPGGVTLAALWYCFIR